MNRTFFSNSHGNRVIDLIAATGHRITGRLNKVQFNKPINNCMRNTVFAFYSNMNNKNTVCLYHHKLQTKFLTTFIFARRREKIIEYTHRVKKKN